MALLVAGLLVSALRGVGRQGVVLRVGARLVVERQAASVLVVGWLVGKLLVVELLVGEFLVVELLVVLLLVAELVVVMVLFAGALAGALPRSPGTTSDAQKRPSPRRPRGHRGFRRGAAWRLGLAAQTRSVESVNME